MNTQDKIGILLLNLGGPERLEDVRPFLVNLFSDRHAVGLVEDEDIFDVFGESSRNPESQ